MPTRIVVARVSDVPPGECRPVEVGTMSLALCNVGGTIYALDNACPHAGGPLGEGFLDGECVECPWHGWRFDVRTGERLENPEIKVERFPVHVEGDTIQVEIP